MSCAFKLSLIELVYFYFLLSQSLKATINGEITDIVRTTQGQTKKKALFRGVFIFSILNVISDIYFLPTGKVGKTFKGFYI